MAKQPKPKPTTKRVGKAVKTMLKSAGLPGTTPVHIGPYKKAKKSK